MESKETKPKKLHPFNVMDQTAAHRLAMEGFEIINVIPSNKYADKAHFIFCFDGTAKFKKRFAEVLSEVEAAAEREEKEKAEVLAETERLKAENERLNALICGKSCEKSAENEVKTGGIDLKKGEKCEENEESYEADTMTEEITVDMDNKAVSDIIDSLARLEALGNCILSNVAAANFYKRLHNKEEG
ncbi:MAG: hypothetical protein NC078_04115 [Ruminococcus sp.]|nr:hypothetical protein [Ruminococcus sp.]